LSEVLSSTAVVVAVRVSGRTSWSRWTSVASSIASFSAWFAVVVAGAWWSRSEVVVASVLVLLVSWTESRSWRTTSRPVEVVTVIVVAVLMIIATATVLVVESVHARSVGPGPEVAIGTVR